MSCKEISTSYILHVLTSKYQMLTNKCFLCVGKQACHGYVPVLALTLDIYRDTWENIMLSRYIFKDAFIRVHLFNNMDRL